MWKKRNLKNPEQIDHFKGHQCILKKYTIFQHLHTNKLHWTSYNNSKIRNTNSAEPIEIVSLNAKLSVCCFWHTCIRTGCSALCHRWQANREAESLFLRACLIYDFNSYLDIRFSVDESLKIAQKSNHITTSIGWVESNYFVDENVSTQKMFCSVTTSIMKNQEKKAQRTTRSFSSESYVIWKPYSWRG